MTIIFKNSTKKSTQIRHIWWQIYALLFLLKVFQFDKFEGSDFKYENGYLKFYQKHPNNAFLAQIYAVLYFWKILRFVKFEGVGLKYGNNYFQSLIEKYPNKAFLVGNLRIFVF